MSERTDKEVLDEWIDEHVKATGLALEVVTEAYRREVSVPNLVGHITSIYADQMPQFISYAASEKAEEMRLGQVDRLSDEIHRLDEENNQLRELVRDLYNRLNDIDENCGECRSSCDYDAWNFGDPKCVYARRVRELGIEVDG